MPQHSLTGKWKKNKKANEKNKNLQGNNTQVGYKFQAKPDNFGQTEQNKTIYVLFFNIYFFYPAILLFMLNFFIHLVAFTANKM